MKILLDTHMLLWTLTEDSQLPTKAYEMIKDDENTTFFSSISIWEIAIKRLVHPGKITTLTPQELVALSENANMSELYLKTKHTYLLETLTRPDNAPPHKDPFDRILIAQAKSEGMTFLTHDALLPYYNEPCIVYV